MKDNSNELAKTELREHYLRSVKNPKVLECFAGENRKLYHACYEGTVDSITSLDLKQTTGVIRIDNKKFIASTDIEKYNFFDLDAYGDPYELLLNIMKRKQNEPYVVIITDGLHKTLIYGAGSKLIQTLINNKARIKIPLLNHHHEFIIKIILKKFSDKYKVQMSGIKIIRETTHNKMIYFGMVCNPIRNKL